MQAANYETQAVAASTLIRKLKKEKEAIAEKGEMGIRRIRLIIIGRREQLHKKLEENVAVIWARWSKPVAELHYSASMKKTGDFFYEMDQESITTIWEELNEDFEAMAQEQTQ